MQNTELYKKPKRNRHHHLLATYAKIDNKLKNIISYRIRYVGHTTTDSNNRCLLTAEKI